MPPSRRDESLALLGYLYRRYKALALSVGASLALERRPDNAIAEVDALVADCEHAAVEEREELSEHFEACRDAAARLGDLARESAGGELPHSDGRLNATRASHRRLRKLVWEVVSCEYVPCSGHVGESDRGPEARFAVRPRGV